MLILADEPTGNRDEASRGNEIDIFKQLHKETSANVVVTHDPKVAEEVESTIVLECGKASRVIKNKK